MPSFLRRFSTASSIVPSMIDVAMACLPSSEPEIDNPAPGNNAATVAFAPPMRQQAMMQAGATTVITQYGVLPYRIDPAGRARDPAHHLEGAAALGDPQGQSDPLLPQPRIGGARGLRGSGRRRADRDGAGRHLPLRQEAALGRRRPGRSSPSFRCSSPARPPTGPSAASASAAGSRRADAAAAVEEPELKALILAFQRQRGRSLSARFAGCYGREPLLLGVQDAEIRPRHHAEGGPLLRHVRAPRANPRRRRRRDGADALGRGG